MVLWLVLTGIACLAAFGAAAYLFFGGESAGQGNVRSSIHSLVQSQRRTFDGKKKGPSVFASAEQAGVQRKVTSKLTLEKLLRYARWPIPPVAYYGSMVLISLIVAPLVNQVFHWSVALLSLLAGPLFMGWFLNFCIDRRFKAFDSDYPQFLLSLVGLLKTGMETLSAIDAAAQGLEENSLVRIEIELMIERLRFGVSEDKSIGSFGEDIYHPEIELFVQALLLSRRVGGNLSDTLDRLAKQVRKRQYFRASANAAVGMQRGSIYFILVILMGMEVYLYFAFPEAVVGAIEDDMGWVVWQVSIVLIFLGMYWIRQVTKIRV